MADDESNSSKSHSIDDNVEKLQNLVYSSSIELHIGRFFVQS
jgi:hypothetical protein